MNDAGWTVGPCSQRIRVINWLHLNVNRCFVCANRKCWLKLKFGYFDGESRDDADAANDRDYYCDGDCGDAIPLVSLHRNYYCCNCLSSPNKAAIDRHNWYRNCCSNCYHCIQYFVADCDCSTSDE